MKYRVMTWDRDDRGDMVVDDGQAFDRRELLSHAQYLFLRGLCQRITDERGQMAMSIFDAQRLWGQTAVDELKESIEWNR